MEKRWLLKLPVVRKKAINAIESHEYYRLMNHDEYRSIQLMPNSINSHNRNIYGSCVGIMATGLLSSERSG